MQTPGTDGLVLPVQPTADESAAARAARERVEACESAYSLAAAGLLSMIQAIAPEAGKEMRMLDKVEVLDVMALIRQKQDDVEAAREAELSVLSEFVRLHAAEFSTLPAEFPRLAEFTARIDATRRKNQDSFRAHRDGLDRAERTLLESIKGLGEA